MAKSKKKCRQYSVDYLVLLSQCWTKDYLCAFYVTVLSNHTMKPSKLEDHLKKCHPDKRSNDLKYFQILTEKLQKRPTMDRMFASTSQRDDNGLQASYNIRYIQQNPKNCIQLEKS
ncbi:protein FAM200B [Trichonephila clavipes]|nr:protein FAM200B [Trichonephila clavipes]